MRLLEVDKETCVTILHLPVVCSCTPPRRNQRSPRSRWPVTDVTRLNRMYLTWQTLLKWVSGESFTRVWPLGPPSLLLSTNIVSISLPSQATSLFLWPSNWEPTEVCYFRYCGVVSCKEGVLAAVPPLLTWPGLVGAWPSWLSAVNPQSRGTASSFQTSGRWRSWNLNLKIQNLRQETN